MLMVWLKFWGTKMNKKRMIAISDTSSAKLAVMAEATHRRAPGELETLIKRAWERYERDPWEYAQDIKEAAPMPFDDPEGHTIKLNNAVTVAVEYLAERYGLSKTEALKHAIKQAFIAEQCKEIKERHAFED